MKKYANLFLIIIISCSLVNCKKSKTDVIPPVNHKLILDNTFGNNGRLVFSAKDYYKINLFQNYIILSDDPFQSFRGTFSLSRFNYDGVLDPSYGLGGRLDIPVTKDVYSASVQQDGSCWMTQADIGGIHYNNSGTPDYTIVNNKLSNLLQFDENRLLCFGYDTIFRYNINGSIDLSFGTNGLIQEDGFPITIDPLGNFYTWAGGTPFSIKKIKSNGATDNTFGNDGILDASVVKGDTYNLKIYNNKMYVICSVQNDDYTYSINIKCYSLNGNPDNSFGNSGTLILTYPKPGCSLFTHSIEFQNDNIYILSSCECNSAFTKGVLSRVKTNGLEFKSFGDNGFMLLGDNIGIETDIKIKNDNVFVLAQYSDSTNTSFINSSILLKYNIK